MLRLATVILFGGMAVVLTSAALALSKVMAAIPASVNGGDLASAPAALRAAGLAYAALAVLTALVLLPESRGSGLRRLRTAVLLLDVAVHMLVVVLSLPLVGWVAFGCSVLLLTLLTSALFDGSAARSAAGQPQPPRPVTRRGRAAPVIPPVPSTGR
jgi:hypothetical protein